MKSRLIRLLANCIGISVMAVIIGPLVLYERIYDLVLKVKHERRVG
jgi:hypothetical protein